MVGWWTTIQAEIIKLIYQVWHWVIQTIIFGCSLDHLMVVPVTPKARSYDIESLVESIVWPCEQFLAAAAAETLFMIGDRKSSDKSIKRVLTKRIERLHVLEHLLHPKIEVEYLLFFHIISGFYRVIQCSNQVLRILPEVCRWWWIEWWIMMIQIVKGCIKMKMTEYR